MKPCRAIKRRSARNAVIDSNALRARSRRPGTSLSSSFFNTKGGMMQWIEQRCPMISSLNDIVKKEGDACGGTSCN
jgi:hypothetical protein